MRAVLNATGFNPVLAPFVHHQPSPLFRIVDKPMLVHIIEQLQVLGVRHFEIVLNHLPQMIEEQLGEGRRWGVDITYHLVRDPEKPFSAIAPAAYHWEEKTVLIGDAEILPKLHPRLFAGHAQGGSRLFFHGSRGWIGWGVIPNEVARHLDREWSFAELPEKLKNYAKHPVSGVMLSVKTLYDWQMSNHRMLTVHTPKSVFPATARMIEPGIWVSRATVLHPSVVLKAPVFIGENCQVLENVRIGPDVVIENHCIVDKRSSIIRTLICRSSYVGEGLEIYRSIVDQHTLLNLTLGTFVNITDDFILCNVASPVFRGRLVRLFERSLGFFALMAISPLVAGCAWWYGLTTLPKVQLPAMEESYHWTTFELVQWKASTAASLSRLASLINVASGHLHFVGLRPRSVEEVAALTPDQRRFVLEGKCGWIPVTDVETEADVAVIESLYVARQSFVEDFKLAMQWIFR